MASVMARTEQKMEVTWHVTLLTSVFTHVAGTYQESQPLELRHLTTCQPLPLGCTYTWLGSGWPGLMAWHWFLPISPPWGLAVTVSGLSTTK
jgi:hypothetical protein